ncbi:MAG: CPBP family intramembrane glutamic endopeptidase, partial [Leptolyngbyaceae bacterium]|nr:CPBP family intramembrane glutamic endopeptidase [Leptolyngbyaceae bacterium]
MPDLILILSQSLLPFLENAAFLQVSTFFLLWIAAWLPLAIPTAFAVKWYPSKPITVQQKLPLLASLYLIAPLILGAISEPKRWSFVNYGLLWEAELLISLGIGLILGLLGLLVLFGSQIAMNWMQWELQQVDSLRATFPLALGLGLGVGLIEELIFRGFLLNQFQQLFSGWVAAAIASLIFALLHLVWEGRG